MSVAKAHLNMIDHVIVNLIFPKIDSIQKIHPNQLAIHYLLSSHSFKQGQNVSFTIKLQLKLDQQLYLTDELANLHCIFNIQNVEMLIEQWLQHLSSRLNKLR